MTAAWITIAGLVVGTIAIKATGPVVLGGRRLPARAGDVVALVAPALLAALVLYETLRAQDGGIAIDARVAGVVTAAAALLLRLPILAVVVLAAAASALTRALT